MGKLGLNLEKWFVCGSIVFSLVFPDTPRLALAHLFVIFKNDYSSFY